MDLKKINKDVYVEFQKVFFESNKKAKQKSKGNFYRTLLSRWSKNFLYALNQSVKSGQTMYLDAYRMIGVSGKSFDKLVSMIEGI